MNGLLEDLRHAPGAALAPQQRQMHHGGLLVVAHAPRRDLVEDGGVDEAVQNLGAVGAPALDVDDPAGTVPTVRLRSGSTLCRPIPGWPGFTGWRAASQ